MPSRTPERTRPYRVAIATSRPGIELDQDLDTTVASLQARGMTASAELWDSETVDWGSFDLVVIRSTWDYTDRRDRFLEWARAVPRIANPVDVIAWNTDKRYLSELSARGISTVPTRLLEPGAPIELPAGEVVLKPNIGAGSRGTARFGPNDQSAALSHVQWLHDQGLAAMAQPYLESLERTGERGLVFIGDRYSHTIYKPPMLATRGAFGGQLTLDIIEPVEPADDERQFADAVLDAVPGGRDRLLFARVDVVRGSEDEPTLIELEATEPNLYLVYGPGSAERFTQAVEALLATG